MPASLARWTTGVVPIARSGRTASIAARSDSRLARNTTRAPCASSQSRSASECTVRGQAVPDVGHPRTALDQQPRDQQLRTLVSRERDRAADGGGGKRGFDRGEGRVLRRRHLCGGNAECVTDAFEPVRRTVASDRRGADHRPTGRLEFADRGACRKDGSPPPRRSRARRRARARPGTAPPAPPRGRAARAGRRCSSGSAGNISPSSVTVGRSERPASGAATGPASISARA